MLSLFIYFLPCKEVYAGNKIQNSAAGKGIVNLINDASAFLLLLSIGVAGLCGIYFFIRKNAADEQDQKKWNNRLIVTGFCAIGAVLVTSTINLLTGYFIEQAVA
jgi:hypothetical protein